MVGRGEERLGGGSMGWRVRADEEGEIEVREGGVGRASATICAGCSGRCRSLWRQLAAAGPLWGCYTRPSFNGAAALKSFFLSSSFLFSSCLVLNKNKKYYRVAMSIHIIFTLLLPMRDWRWLKRGLIKVWHFHHSKLCYVNCEIGLCLLRDKMKHSIVIVCPLFKAYWK